MKILYVEDDPRAAREMEDIVRREGDTIAVETNGADGLKRAGLESFDVIVMDRMLGDADGLDIIRRLRGSAISTPILMLSGPRGGRQGPTITSPSRSRRSSWSRGCARCTGARRGANTARSSCSARSNAT